MSSADVKLRNATIEDAKRVFDWRNDPWIAGLSSSGAFVEWDDHMRWFEASLSNEETEVLIIEVDNTGAGQIRFNRTSCTECTVSIYLLQQFTGKGYGKQMLKEGCRVITDKWGAVNIFAYIRSDNHPSLSAFTKSGFVRFDSKDAPEGHLVLVLGSR